MTLATLSFRTEGQVRLRCDQLAIDETRPLGAAPFAAWAREYAAVQHHPAEEVRLLELGRTIGAWLDGEEGWLQRLPDAVPAPLILEIETSARPGAIEQAALDAPWELTARAGTGHLALDDRIRLSPARRLDVPGNARPPSRCRLSVLFMAAQPRDVTTLDFEREEAAIAAEVGKLGPDPFDLFVEESGTLDGLVAAAQLVAEHVIGDSGGPAGPVDVIHVSCHGRGGNKPALLLENDVGDLAEVTAGKFAGDLEAHVPALAFMSACSTADASAVGRSFAAELCTRGWPAIIGWSAPVDDGVAAWFAARLYYRLAQRMSIAEALARCRCDAVAPDRLARRVWHQARLFLGRAGGGPILGGVAARRPARAGQRQYLDRAARVPVARDDEFVGRRRALQRVLGSLGDDRYVGAVVHGAGQLGKSSLAARVSHRRSELRTVVLYKDYDAGAILAAIAHQVEGADEVIKRHRPPERWDAPALRRALHELLEGLCGGAGTGAILLIVDDFEQVLVPPRVPETHAKVRTDLATTIGALIGAFSGARTASRLLFTSRYRFIAPDTQDLELTRYLWHEPLGAMPSDDLAKRVRASVVGGAAPSGGPNADERAVRHAAAIELCLGNPGLLQILLTIIDRAPASWPAVHAELRTYAERGAPVTQVDLAEFMARVALGRLIAELEPSGRALLRLLTAFETSVPTVVAAALGSLAGIVDHSRGPEAIARMISLGLLDLSLPSSSQPGAPSRSNEREIAVNRLASPLAIAATRPILDDEVALVAQTALHPLRAAWDSAVRSRGLRECRELSRLARIADDISTLAEVAGPVVIVTMLTDPREAAVLVLEVEASDALWPNANELCIMAHVRVTTGHSDAAWRLLRRGLALKDLAPGERARLQLSLAAWHQLRGEFDAALRILKEETLPAFEQLGDAQFQAMTLGHIAEILRMRGDLDAALQILKEETLPVYQRLGEARGQSVAQGQIADILQARGELEAALRVRMEEQLPIFERLGDERLKALTQVQIADILIARGELNAAARILKEAVGTLEQLGDVPARAMGQERIANILQARGELDAALQIRIEEQLPIYERLGDVRATAGTQGQIADILQARGELEAALRIRIEEQLPIYERLGEPRLKTVTQGQIADILQARGELDAALRIRIEEQLPIYERLGDERAKAVTHGQIADILQARGDLEAALRIRTKEELPVYERLGDAQAKAVSQGKIADILQARGELDAALRIRTEEELPIYERLGDVRAKAVTQGKIADILSVRGELDESLRILKEALPVYERLGDVRLKAVTQGQIADILHARGELDAALRIRTEEELPVYERLGDVRAKAVTQGKIADILYARGELDAALRLLKEVDHTFERLGEVRLKAVAQGQIADILQGRGELDAALRIRSEEQLPVFERLGDVRAMALTQTQIAGILMARGELDAALRLLSEEALPVYKRLGDVRLNAVAQGQIADILMLRGELDAALRIRTEEELLAYERLGDVRAKAVTQAKIVDILMTRGEHDIALRILREAGSSFEQLGDVRATAVTQGQLASILMARGELDAALRLLREEALPVYERLGDVRLKAVAQGKIADILHARGELDAALRIRTEEELLAYEQLGDVRAKAVTQAKIAEILMARGELDVALRILREAGSSFEQLGDVRAKAAMQEQVANILMARGELDVALRILVEEQVPVYELLGDVQLEVVTQGQIAGILYARGELDAALRILKEVCGLYERLGDVQSLCGGLASYAQMLLTEPTGDRIVEARGSLRRLAAIADRLGLPLPDEIRGLLAQLEQLP